MINTALLRPRNLLMIAGIVIAVRAFVVPLIRRIDGDSA